MDIEKNWMNRSGSWDRWRWGYACLRGCVTDYWKVLCACLLVATTDVFAIKTHEVHHYTYSDFIRGDLNALSLSQQGTLRLAPELREIAEIADTIIFDAVADRQGNLYLGSGNQGKIYKVTPAGEVETLFSSAEILIRALAVDSQDNLYVGTAPDGRVYRLRPGENPEVYFDPEATYIWDLLIDDEDNLYVATGSPAKIYKLAAAANLKDEAELLFETREEHIPVIAVADDGALLAGTSPGAFIYRVVAGDTQGSVLHNADADEITAIFPDPTGIFFATMMDGESSGNQTPMDLPDILQKIQTFKSPTVISKKGGGAQQPKSGSSASDSKGAHQTPSFIHRLQANGFAEPVWSPGSANIFSMMRLEAGGWLIGTDNEGRLYKVDTKGEWQLYQRAPKGGDVSVLLATPGTAAKTYVITSNPAVVYELSDALPAQGSFVSPVIDAQQTARWGHLRTTGAFAGTQPVGMAWSTRSGNVPVPDDTWSDWQAAASLHIQSPAARYLQYRVEFSAGDAQVDDVRLFYSLFNVAPIVSQINVLPIGIDVFELKVPRKPNLNLAQLLNTSVQANAAIMEDIEDTQTKQHYRATGEQGFMSFVWNAVDPNGDTLRYQLELKKQDDRHWSVLTDDLRNIAYSINTRGYADGYYTVKVIADDSEDNFKGEGKQGYRLSYPFLIDNGSPTIRFVSQAADNGGVTVMFVVEDAFSIVNDVRYILNGRALRSLIPTDMHYDQQTEAFELVLEQLEPGVHSLIIEAKDELNNHATLQLPLTVEE